MKEDLLMLAESAYRIYHLSRGTIPEYTFDTLPADQKAVWENVAFAVLLQAVQLAYEHTQANPMEGVIQ